MPYNTQVSAQIDFSQPLDGEGIRLQHRWCRALQIWQAWDAESLQQVLHEVEAAARAGDFCVGGLRYEAASALDAGWPTCAVASRVPLAWFARYAAPAASAEQGAQESLLSVAAPATVHWQDSVTREVFDGHMATIHEDTAAGHYYQVNYTQQLQGRAQEAVDGRALFQALQQAQPGGYALYLDMGTEHVASVSPELFFDWHQPVGDQGRILARPMKGTAARGMTAQQDAEAQQHLLRSPKERAENVMIVDLLRNDLGKLAVTGTVHVPRLFHTQALPSVWQMTSDVCASLPVGTGLLQVMQALFPCGSITGAPKRAAMQAIAALEGQPRGWYCGALGVVRPDGAGGIRATFNVPIRTVVVQGQQLWCGVGSGMTADATAEGEWREWRVKQAFVKRVSEPFEVLTTMALEDGVFRHQPWHVQRLQQAAAHFGFPYAPQAVQQCLQQLSSTYPQGLWRVRVALDAQGQLHHQVQAMVAAAGPVQLKLASRALIQARSEFVRFKTSRRAHYEQLAHSGAAVFDTLLWNEDGEITECTRGNIAALLDGRWITPALHCGLLNGVGRQVALAEGRVQEAVLRLEDVPRVQQWAFVNSLRGWLDARLAHPRGPGI